MLAPAYSHLELLPNELLDQILSYLTTEPPSLEQLHHPPNLQLTQSPTNDLKHLTQCSRRLLELVRPRLFSHACLDLYDEPDFRCFMTNSNLAPYVTSLVATTDDNPDRKVDRTWWRRVLRYLDPHHVIVVAPPDFIGDTLATPIFDGHKWAFDMPLQILALQRECMPRDLSQLPDLETCTSLLASRPWTSMTFNESSSLKAYNHYEYFLTNVPSVLPVWGTGTGGRALNIIDLPVLLHRLTSFSYTAVFPFYNHSQLVLYAVSRMDQLRRLYVQLAPCEGNHITELEQRGSMDPNDPWMELGTSYTLIAHTVSNMPSLKELRCGDLHVEAIRVDLIVTLEDSLGEDWPAFPILADSLLPPPIPPENAASSSSKTASKDNWSLENDWVQGIQSSKKSIFRCGVVIGFSRLRTRSKESNEYIAQVPRHILTSHLRVVKPSDPTAFIIHPGSFEAFAPRTLLNELQSSSHGQSGLTRDEAIQRLDSVQLLPVHQFPNAAQAIGKVSDVLHRIQEKRDQRDEPTEPSGTSSNDPILLIVVGLDTLAEGVVRASNPVRGAAVLTATLRTLTRLSRVHASYLSVIMVNTNGIGSINPEWMKNKQSTGNTTSHEDNVSRQPLEDGIHSIFHSDISSLFPTVLLKALDQGIDTHLLISDLRGAQIVEVIKDRVGTGLGKWGIWKE
ncbi:hypothetical protein N7461_005774 [Penicillium sp. DV-2018c]|nr:hypothetical protein N7461_005774 [Penicillium sp. DV-2018c]